MPPVELAERLALVLALAFFLGLAFEEIYKREERTAPGGVRTFPMLALAGAMLDLVEPHYALAFVAGLAALAVWLHAFLRIDRPLAEGAAPPTLMIAASNLVAYVIGPIALTQPPWVAVGLTVAAVLLIGMRERIHMLPRLVPQDELLTAGKFLILGGIILPLLPDTPLIAAAPLTPYRVWLAVVAVSAVSYASYLAQRYLPGRHRALLPAILGGVYSSTVTTVALAKRARAVGRDSPGVSAGLIAATAIMYVRLGIVILPFSPGLAARLAPAFALLFLIGAALAWREWRRTPPGAPEELAIPMANPLQLTTALVFAAVFVAVSLASAWVEAVFGRPGIMVLAGLVGLTDIDPFVLSLAQGGVPGMSLAALAGAVLIAAAANNLVKAAYAIGFGGFAAVRRPAIVLAILAVLGLAAAVPYLS